MDQLLVMDQEWQDQAACREIPLETFFPPAEQEATDAKSVCLGCCVKNECLEFAIQAGERFGIWGGLTPQERRSLVARRRSRAALLETATE